jgi:nitrate reductase beta subunit
VGRIRYLGVLLYDADRISEAAAVQDEKNLYQAQCDIFLDPNDPKVQELARLEGIPDSWIEAAKRSPVYKMAMEWKVAFPLHPEYRTLPMVWYIPPLSPIQSAAEAGAISRNGILPDVKDLRIPVRYLANLLTAGEEAPVEHALNRMLAMRAYMRDKTVNGRSNTDVLDQVGMSEHMVQDMYQVMAIANYEDRFVIPTSHREYAGKAFDAFDTRSSCGFSFGNGCSEGETKTVKFFGVTTHKNTMSGR